MAKDSTGTKNLFMFLLAGGLFLVGAAAVILFLPQAQQQVLSAGGSVVPVKTNFPAPDLKLTDVNGKAVSLDDYRGKIILINNWATWCPPCQEEMPTLEAYYKAHSSQGFFVVAIEAGEPADQVKDFVNKYGITFPVWLDADSKALNAFNNWDLPSSYVVDKDGTVRLTWTGAVDRATLEKYVTPLLEK